MTRTALRLAELDRISRERPLTDAEQVETYRLVRLQRQCELRRERYASDPAYRARFTVSERTWRMANHRRRWEVADDPEYRQRLRERAAGMGRDEQGRFV